MCFELNIFTNNVKDNVSGEVHSQKYCRLQCVTKGFSLTISYHPYFLRISKVWSMFYRGLVGRVQSKECYFCLRNLFWHCFFFFIKKFALPFSFLFFYEASSFHNRILTNQKLEQMIRNYQWNCMQNRDPKTLLNSVTDVSIIVF